MRLSLFGKDGSAGARITSREEATQFADDVKRRGLARLTVEPDRR